MEWNVHMNVGKDLVGDRCLFQDNVPSFLWIQWGERQRKLC